jgi:Cd2+/Zn2+-exporting ATPase
MTTSPLEYFVENMDCASCVQKVERMVATLPGAAAVQTSFAKQTLKLTLDETQTPRATLESRLGAMGYAPSPLVKAVPAASHSHADHHHAERAHEQGHSHEGHDHHGHTHAVPTSGRPWYATGQGRLVVASGALLALAFAFSFIAPDLAVFGYVAPGPWPEKPMPARASVIRSASICWSARRQ